MIIEPSQRDIQTYEKTIVLKLRGHRGIWSKEKITVYITKLSY